MVRHGAHGMHVHNAISTYEGCGKGLKTMGISGRVYGDGRVNTDRTSVVELKQECLAIEG